MEKTIRTIILVLAILLFLGMTNIVNFIYPNSATIYDEFTKAYYLEERLEEVFAMLLFLYCFLKSTQIRKGLACFGFTIVFASMVDKLFFNEYHYLSTDIIILIFASILGFVAYIRQ